MKKRIYGRDITFLFIESTLTSFIVFMPVAYLLFKDIGLSQFQIGLVQFTFLMTIMLLDIPTGYFADRVSRKISNAGGDLFIAAAALMYFFAGGFWDAVLAEVLFGIGISLTNGADSALLRAHCKLQNIDFLKLSARLQSYGFFASGAGAIIGGLIGAYNIRWPFLLQCVIFLIATSFAFTIKNAGTHRKTTIHPLKDIARIVQYSLSGHPLLAWRIALGASLMCSTYFLVWFMTPSFLAAGIAVRYHGLFFAAISIMAIIGSEFIARRKQMRVTTPFLLSAAAYFILGWNIILLTVFIILLSSFARGINSATVKPYIQDASPDDVQATALSVFGMVQRVLCAVLGLLVNYIGNSSLQHGLMTAGVLCVILWVIFRKNESKFGLRAHNI